MAAMSAFPPAVRKMIYALNALESLDRSPRKIIGTRGGSPATKRGRAARSGDPERRDALMAPEACRDRPVDWAAALGRLAILFEDGCPASAG